jgi:RNA polymerase sigma-70 factor (ECF subfamily)
MVSPARLLRGEERGDAELVAGVLGGDQELYAVLVERHQERLYRHALGMVKHPDAAADLVQDGFIKAYSRLQSCSDPERFGAWIFRILRNRCLDYLKNRRRQTVPLDERTALAPSRDDPEIHLERSELGRAVERALGTLPDAQREAFLLKHVDGCSYEEMAERLDASVSALKMRVMRAREALQVVLAEVHEPSDRV